MRRSAAGAVPCGRLGRSNENGVHSNETCVTRLTRLRKQNIQRMSLPTAGKGNKILGLVSPTSDHLSQ